MNVGIHETLLVVNELLRMIDEEYLDERDLFLEVLDISDEHFGAIRAKMKEAEEFYR